jgi:hypothetical protein
MNIKENFYIYHFNKQYILIEEQKHTKESDNQNTMFDISTRPHKVMRHTGINTRHNTR